MSVNISGNLKKRLKEENIFITDLIELIKFPIKNSESDSESGNDEEKIVRTTNGSKISTGRATSIGELHERLNKKLQELRGPSRNGNPKHKLTKAEKKQKAKEEKRLSSKLVKQKTYSENFNNKMAKAAQKVGAKPPKPVFNAEGRMVFSKFDFTDDGGFKAEDTTKKVSLDPKSALAKLEKHKERIKSLAEQGNVEKARILEDNNAWRTALDRSSGLKVKDDASLLKKSIKKQAQRKGKSKKKWDELVTKEENRKTQKQQKRSENLAKRKADKKDKNRKKGKKVPGFR